MSTCLRFQSVFAPTRLTHRIQCRIPTLERRVDHLVLLLDPAWPFEEGAKLEGQFLQPLQAFRYPFVGSIDIRWLAAPAAPHSLPSLLAVLHWLTDLGKVRFAFLNATTAHRMLVRHDFTIWKAVMQRYKTLH